MSASDVAPWVAGGGASIAAFIAGYFQARQAKIASNAPQTTAIVDGFKALLAATNAEIARLQVEQEILREKMEICETAREEGRSERQKLVSTIEEIMVENADLRSAVEEGREERHRLMEATKTLSAQVEEMHSWNQAHRSGTLRTRASDPREDNQ